MQDYEMLPGRKGMWPEATYSGSAIEMLDENRLITSLNSASAALFV